MSQETAINSSLQPPAVPLHILREPKPAPLQPPGMFSAMPAGGAKGKKKERRLGLAGLEAGDPRSTYHLVKLGLKNAVNTVPKLLARYWWVVLVAVGVWALLGSFNAYRLSSKFPALTPLWFSLEKIVLFLVFLTAAYNNFLAKAIYAGVVVRVGIPLFGRVRREGIPKVINDFKGLVPGFKSSWDQAGAAAASLLVGFIGVGAFVSNYLTRNNRIDKIAVSLALALALSKALSDGPKSLPFMTGRVVMKDFFFLMAKPSPVRNHHIYVAVSGMVMGLLCCIPFTQLSKMISDDIGYIAGVIAMIAAVALFFVKKGQSDKPSVQG